MNNLRQASAIFGLQTHLLPQMSVTWPRAHKSTGRDMTFHHNQFSSTALVLSRMHALPLGYVHIAVALLHVDNIIVDPADLPTPQSIHLARIELANCSVWGWRRSH